MNLINDVLVFFNLPPPPARGKWRTRFSERLSCELWNVIFGTLINTPGNGFGCAGWKCMGDELCHWRACVHTRRETQGHSSRQGSPRNLVGGGSPLTWVLPGLPPEMSAPGTWVAATRWVNGAGKGRWGHRGTPWGAWGEVLGCWGEGPKVGKGRDQGDFGGKEKLGNLKGESGLVVCKRVAGLYVWPRSALVSAVWPVFSLNHF